MSEDRDDPGGDAIPYAYLPHLPGGLTEVWPCAACGRTRQTLYFIDDMDRCYDCARSWRVTKTGVVLRLASRRRGK